MEYNQDTRSPAGVGIRPKPCENTRKWDQDTFDVYVSRRAPGYMSEIHAGFIRIHAGYSQDTLLTKQRQDTPGSRARCIEDTHTIYGQDTCSPAPLGIRSTSIRIRAGYAQDTPQNVTSVVFWRALQRMPTFEASLWSLVLIRVFAFSPELLSLLLQHGHVHTSRAGAAVDASAQLLLVVVAQGRVFALLQVG